MEIFCTFFYIIKPNIPNQFIINSLNNDRYYKLELTLYIAHISINIFLKFYRNYVNTNFIVKILTCIIKFYILHTCTCTIVTKIIQ